MELTKEEFDRLENVKSETRVVIQNKAFTSLSPELACIIEELGKKYHPLLCVKCGAGKYMIITRLYDAMLRDEQRYAELEKQKEQEVQNDSNKQESGQHNKKRKQTKKTE